MQEICSGDFASRSRYQRWSLEYLSGKLSLLWLKLLCRDQPTGLDRIPGHLHPIEGRFLYWLAGRVPAGGCVIEIGSYLGKSSAFLASGLRDGAKLVCVDTWHNDAMLEEPQDVLPQFQANMRPFGGKFEIARGRSEQIAGEWTRPIDALFIDGDHSYRGCTTDLKCWLPFVKSGSWIAFHDSAVIGVARAIEECFPRQYRVGLPRRIWSIFAARKR
jgi:predicted O-methyltransferase YrrM